MKADTSLQQQPVIPRLEDFDKSSGNLLERIFFNHRFAVIIVCVIVTLILGYEATKLRVNAGFDKMIPTKHPYIVNYLANRKELKGLGNIIHIGVEMRRGTIFDGEYLQTLQKINDEVFFIPGLQREAMKSLWTPATRWLAVTEEGLAGGPVIPGTYDGSAQSIREVRINVERSGEIGKLVATDFRSSIIDLPLLDFDPTTGKPLDYSKLSKTLEKVRDKYNSDTIKLHITGFAKIVGDLIDGLQVMMLFFLLAIIVDGALLLWYIRCLRSAFLIVACSLVAVLWLLGFLPLLGFDLDPYSVLVPFLVFAIGMSHGSQKMNGIMQDIGRGTHRVVAARYTFRRLFTAGLTALLADAVGFGVLMLIRIKVIQDLAITASIGVAILIFTNLMLLPILLSYTGVNAKAAARSLREESSDKTKKHFLWKFLDLFTQRKWAIVAIVCFMILGGVGIYGRMGLCIGDIDKGAPELRPDSRYNQDNAFMVAHYAASSDVLVVIVKTPPNEGVLYKNLMKMDALEAELRQLEGVESTASLASLCKMFIMGLSEGNPKWYELLRNQSMLQAYPSRCPLDLLNGDCSVLPILVYLKDHKAQTLTSVVEKVDEFARNNNRKDINFLLAAGNAGIEAATNISVKKAMHDMLFFIYGAVILLCFIAFRSWRAVVVSIIPLLLTSILCEALMAVLGIGVKVATLPVIALGVGIGVDYALYMVSVLMARLREGMDLSSAYYAALCFTGRIVLLTGLTLAVSVVTWFFAPIKFQADMGILLTFMFVWNMLGALIMIPALGCFLLKPKKVKEPLAGVGKFSRILL
ncbi:MAG TPA: MMPL family transporter [Thermodesulfobacteriota bacterium]|nr:MMPL family transporter [Thermodesulfobacteriota bacterium]